MVAAAITVIEIVLPTLVTKIATLVSAGVRWSIIHCQTGGSMDARPLLSVAPSASPSTIAASTASRAPLVISSSAVPGDERRQRTAATAPSTSRTSAATA